MHDKFLMAIGELEKRAVTPETGASLHRMKQALQIIGFFDWPFTRKNKLPRYSTIIVAGTNGKGTTCAALVTLLTAAGETVGFYSSPHLENYTERIRIGMQPITEDLFARAHEKIVSATRGLPLTHFDVLTLMAVWVFCSGEARPVCDRLIFEVGLGGTFDATNALPHDFAVITRLGLDHENLLGRGLANIAKNKLGVAPEEGGVVVHVPFAVEAAEVLATRKKQTTCQWLTPVDYSITVLRGREPKYFLTSRWGELQLPLPGARAAENINLAITAFNVLGFEPNKFLPALEKLHWPGRMELTATTQRGARIYLSGDHNPQGIQSLTDLLKDFDRKKIFFIVGIGKDKNRKSMLAQLSQVEDSEIYLTTAPFRGGSLKDYRDDFGDEKKNFHTFEKVDEALETAARKASIDDLIVVTGSLYLIGQVRSLSFTLL